jgi:hypothetical protein
MTKYTETPFTITIPADTKVIGMQMSGGADSTLAAYLYAKVIKENNLDVKLKRITFSFSDKYDTFETARLAQDNITALLEFDPWEEAHEVLYKEKKLHSTIEQLQYLFDGGLIDHTVYSRTMNPSVSLIPDPENNRVLDRDAPIEDSSSDISEPFYNFKKDVLLQKYIDLGIYDSLFAQTVSCDTDKENGLVPPCNECWWCKERAWAITQVGK